MAEAKKAAKAAEPVKEVKATVVDTETPEAVLKAKKQAVKAEKKAEPAEDNSKKVKAKVEKAAAAPVKVRSRLERRSKKYRKAAEHVEPNTFYSLDEAVALLPKTTYSKFDGSIELHINLNVDPKQADQLVRGTTPLPHGSGRSQRVAVFTENAAVAKKAGADIAGTQEVIDQIEKNKFEFDILVATPDVMAQLGKHAKVLGPKGLMPNPKSGTVTKDIEKTVKELKAGRVEFRVDSAGIIHQVIGKVSFQPEQIAENLKALLKAVQAVKPPSVKGTYIQRLSITTSMGPGIKLDVSKVLASL